jgi:hypothetical protein
MNDLTIPMGFTPPKDEMLLQTVIGIYKKVEQLPEFQKSMINSLSTGFSSLAATMTKEFRTFREDGKKEFQESQKSAKDLQKNLVVDLVSGFENGFARVYGKESKKWESFYKDFHALSKTVKEYEGYYKDFTSDIRKIKESTNPNDKGAQKALNKAELAANDSTALKDFAVNFASRDKTLSYLMTRFSGITKESNERQSRGVVEQRQAEAIGVGPEFDKTQRTRSDLFRQNLEMKTVGKQHAFGWRDNIPDEPFKETSQQDSTSPMASIIKGLIPEEPQSLSSVTTAASPSDVASATTVLDATRLGNLALINAIKGKEDAEDAVVKKGGDDEGGLISKVGSMITNSAIGKAIITSMGPILSGMGSALAAAAPFLIPALLGAGLMAIIFTEAGQEASKRVKDAAAKGQEIGAQQGAAAVAAGDPHGERILQAVGMASSYVNSSTKPWGERFEDKLKEGDSDALIISRFFPNWKQLGNNFQRSLGVVADGTSRQAGITPEIIKAANTVLKYHKGGVVGLPSGQVSSASDEVPTMLQRGEVVLSTDVGPLYKEMADNTGKTADILDNKISSILESIRELLGQSLNSDSSSPPMPIPTILNKGIS